MVKYLDFLYRDSKQSAPGLDPGAVHYALEHWERPWVLLIDIDAKEIARERAEDTVSDDMGDQYDEALLDTAGILDFVRHRSGFQASNQKYYITKPTRVEKECS